MRITMVPTVSFDDIQDKFGFHMKDVPFCDMAENGSYVSLALDEDEVTGISGELADMEECTGAWDERYKSRLRNQLTLINYFRELGYTEEILIFICW